MRRQLRHQACLLTEAGHRRPWEYGLGFFLLALGRLTSREDGRKRRHP